MCATPITESFEVITNHFWNQRPSLGMCLYIFETHEILADVSTQKLGIEWDLNPRPFKFIVNFYGI